MFWLLGSFSGVRWLNSVGHRGGARGSGGLPVVCRALDVHLRRRCRRLAGDCCAARAPGILFTTAALITATIVSMAGSIQRLLAGGAARDAFLLWPAAPNVADRRAGGGDIDGTGGHCVAPADCPAKVCPLG